MVVGKILNVALKKEAISSNDDGLLQQKTMANRGLLSFRYAEIFGHMKGNLETRSESECF